MRQVLFYLLYSSATLNRSLLLTAIMSVSTEDDDDDEKLLSTMLFGIEILSIENIFQYYRRNY